MIEFEKNCERVRTFFEVSQEIEKLKSNAEVYEAIGDLIVGAIEADTTADELEAIITTIAEAITS
jgi:chaperonin cofactor prefoldin